MDKLQVLLNIWMFTGIGAGIMWLYLLYDPYGDHPIVFIFVCLFLVSLGIILS